LFQYIYDGRKDGRMEGWMDGKVGLERHWDRKYGIDKDGGSQN
jgi:hypothetical protein